MAHGGQKVRLGLGCLFCPDLGHGQFLLLDLELFNGFFFFLRQLLHLGEVLLQVFLALLEVFIDSDAIAKEIDLQTLDTRSIDQADLRIVVPDLPKCRQRELSSRS